MVKEHNTWNDGGKYVGEIQGRDYKMVKEHETSPDGRKVCRGTQGWVNHMVKVTYTWILMEESMKGKLEGWDNVGPE